MAETSTTSTIGNRRAASLTLVAMTLANSMILVDQTAVPLATPDAVADLGASLSDQFGLRRIFLLGAVGFTSASALAGAAQSFPWLLSMRLAQGAGAALMMPATMAIVAAVFPEERRGRALGLLAGASAFFAALGPVLGGLLTEITWRMVLWINVPLAVICVIMTLSTTPDLRPAPGTTPSIDLKGVVTFAIGIGAITLGLGQGQDWGWLDPGTLACFGVGIVGLVVFVLAERHARSPLVTFSLFRHRNYSAANLSQVLAGAIELGTGFLLPFFLLLMVGLSPGAAGLALIPATVPVIVVAPLAGRWFDRFGGRQPMIVGFLVLAASAIALVLAFPSRSVAALVPGLVLQGIGLGIVLTVNDPVGINSVPEEDRGQASGVIDTAEQMGGAIGIAGLMALFMTYYFNRFFGWFDENDIHLSGQDFEAGKEFVLRAEQQGLSQVDPPPQMLQSADAFFDAHLDAYRLTFLVVALIAVVGAVVCGSMVRKQGDDGTDADRPRHRIFSRRSRWIWTHSGVGPGITRKPESAAERPQLGGEPAT